jgi:hypothetical protein
MTATPFRFLLPLALAMASAITSVAWAGEYFEKDGVAIRSHSPLAYFKDGKPVKGSADMLGHVAKADSNWPAVSRQTKVIE